LFKVYAENDKELSALAGKLGISLEEMRNRIKYEASYFYMKNDRFYKLPIGLSKKSMEAWRAKCINPIVKIDEIKNFYSFARLVLKEDHNYMLVGYGLNEN